MRFGANLDFAVQKGPHYKVTSDGFQVCRDTW